MKNKIGFSEFFKSKTAFSLVEFSIIVLIVGIIITSIIAGQKLVRLTNLSKARSLTNSSPVNGTENLVLWLETTSKNSFINSAPNDGDFISTWKDINPQKTNKNDATQPGATSLQPTYVANGINGLPVLQFSSSKTNFFTINNTIGQMGMDTGAKEFFIVLNDQSTSGQSIPIGTTTDNVHILLYTDISTLYLFNEAATLLVPKNTVNGSNYIFNGRVDANNNATISVNNSGDNVTALSTTSAMVGSGSFYIGRTPQASPTYFFYGQIGEIIMFSRNLSVVERNDIKNYLSKKWGIKLN